MDSALFLYLLDLHLFYVSLATLFLCRECPEECRAAVSSLMFAAARFSDLPELRDLREIFYERFGNSLELFVNQEVLPCRRTFDRIL